MEWSLADAEIHTPKFSDDGKFIAVVTVTHWPDGHEAEGTPETFLKQLEFKKKENPRFADPVMRLLDSSGNETCSIQYGWNPSVSGDDKRIAFSYQRKPITGFRALADTMEGNDIRLFDCETKTLTVLAQPEWGYLDNPEFISSSNSILYSLNEATNGAMGGATGLELTSLSESKKVPVIAKVTTKSLSGKTSYSRLLLDSFVVGDQVFALVAEPGKRGDEYMASSYQVMLVSAFPTEKTIHSFGSIDLWDVAIQLGSPKDAMVYLKEWRPLSLETGEWLPIRGPANYIRQSFYSPDRTYFVAFERDPKGEAEPNLVLHRTDDGTAIATFADQSEIVEIAWSHDSKKFAFSRAVESGSTHYREVLSVYEIN